MFLRTTCLVVLLWVLSASANAMNLQGCQDPKYHTYIEQRFASFAQNTERMHAQTLREYDRLVQNQAETFAIISALTRHLRYSAQRDSIEEVNQKVDILLAYSDSLSMEKRIAGLVLDEFSTENHAINMANAWIAYRQGDLEGTEQAILESLNIKNSMLLSAFGPDFSLIRQLYRDGHRDIVKSFLKQTEDFWQTSEAKRLRFVWAQMMILDCQIQFDSGDIVQAMNLGIRAQR